MERSMAGKITQIVAGEAHTLALTGDGKVFSWGRGVLGQLGNGKEEDQLFPAPVIFRSLRKTTVGTEHDGESLRFIAIASGARHSLALRDDGSIWSWGYNAYGQLGQGREGSSVPVLVERFLGLETSEGPTESEEKNNHLKVCYIKAGGMMSTAIDSHGDLWMWGNCPQAGDTEDGESCLIRCPDPMPVWEFHGRVVVKVACGDEHVLALVGTGESFRGGGLICFSWGNNRHGQLGMGDVEKRARPQLVALFDEDSSWSVYEIACGAFHSAVLTQGKSAGEEIGCKCWTFGLGRNGQLGLGSSIDSWVPQPVSKLPKDAILISLDCGPFHTCVVSAGGDVWSWGMAGGRGSGEDAGDAAFYPQTVLSLENGALKFPIPVQVTCGEAHTVLITDDGYKLWAWGRGRHGVLGRGSLEDSFAPCMSRWPPPHSHTIKNKEVKGGSSQRSRHGSDHQKQQLSAALEEARSKLAVMQRYATLLHVSAFGMEKDLPQSLGELDAFDIKTELDNAVESADDAALLRLEMFYRKMLRNVESTMLRRKVRDMVRELLLSEQK